MTGNVLTVAKFAACVGMSERKAREALRKCHDGGCWRGVLLTVSQVRAAGGPGGLAYVVDRATIPVSFLVEVAPALIAASEASEAPLAIRADLEPSQAALVYPRSRVTGPTTEAEWRLAHVLDVRRSTKAGTRERTDAIAELAVKSIVDWQGRQRTISARTLRRWIAHYDASGFQGLMRKAPQNAGKKRVYLSRAWDQAMRDVGVREDALVAVVDRIRKRVRGEWASGTPSWPTVQLNTLPTSISAARKAGISLPDVPMRTLCQVPRRFVEAERRYRLVAMKTKDAARFYSVAEPNIKRDRSNLRPGEWLAADVHHIDILFKCPDGREVTPKAVAWLDLATNRAWLDIYILPKGQMIRTEHVVQSFVNRCIDPNCGVPTRLYTDHGGEYNWAELTNDISKLKRTIELRIGENPDEEVGVQRARPYNPKGKVIESLFATVEKVAFSQLSGSIGGNRLVKKTANQGRAPSSFSGDEKQLREALATALAYYHIKQQDKTSHLAGLSPNESYQQFVDGGWSAITLDPWELSVAFSAQLIKPVRAGGTLRLSRRDFRADELQPYVGRKVLVRQPLFGDRDMVYVFTEHGAPLAIAQPDLAYFFGSKAGAGEQARRSKALTHSIKAMAKESDPSAAGGEAAMADVVAMFPDAPQAQPSGTIIQLNPEFSEAALMAKAAPARAEEEIDRRIAKQAEQYAFVRRLAASG